MHLAALKFLVLEVTIQACFPCSRHWSRQYLDMSALRGSLKDTGKLVSEFGTLRLRHQAEKKKFYAFDPC